MKYRSFSLKKQQTNYQFRHIKKVPNTWWGCLRNGGHETNSKALIPSGTANLPRCLLLKRETGIRRPFPLWWAFLFVPFPPCCHASLEAFLHFEKIAVLRLKIASVQRQWWHISVVNGLQKIMISNHGFIPVLHSYRVINPWRAHGEEQVERLMLNTTRLF
jgi:hypothetical protein